MDLYVLIIERDGGGLGNQRFNYLLIYWENLLEIKHSQKSEIAHKSFPVQ
jgi:hypothetical protein